jgi:hypothetical protein
MFSTFLGDEVPFVFKEPFLLFSSPWKSGIELSIVFDGSPIGNVTLHFVSSVSYDVNEDACGESAAELGLVLFRELRTDFV